MKYKPKDDEIGLLDDEVLPQSYYGHEAKTPWMRVKKMSTDQMEHILQSVCEGRSVSRSAEEVSSTLWTVKRQMKADKGFRQAMEEALEIRTMMLEEKAFELAYNGQTRTVVKGDQVYESTEYPTWTLGQYLLKAYEPEKYGIDRQRIQAGPLDAPPVVVRSDGDRERLVDRLREAVAARALAPPTRAVEDDEPAEGEFDDLL